MGVLALALLDCPGGALASGATQPLAHPTALLYGRPIPLAEVRLHHCHDLDAPSYRCFDTAAERDEDLAGVAIGERLAALSSVPYVLFFVDANYGGSSLAIADPTPNLGSLGWSNIISSFKSTNGGRPKWWDGANYSGSSWQWAASAWVAYVGDTANDRLTSVKNSP